MPKKLYLVDGSSYLFRAFHAMGDLRNSSGFPTGASFNFTQMISRLIKEEDAEQIAVVFDPEGPSFRKEMFEPYKANRDDTPEDLVKQIPYVMEILDALGVPRLAVDNYEADDVIATLAREAERKDFEVILVSSDKDLTQLLDGNITMYDTMRNRRMDEEYVRERYGVKSPDQMVDYLALVGDSSDNIPGISGIGKKSAQKLLQQFDSMEEAFENAEQIESTRIKNALKRSDEDGNLFKDLIRLREDVPMDVEPEELTVSERDTEKLRDLYKELEFNNLLDDLPPETSLDETTYNCIHETEDLENLIQELRDADTFTFDLETNGLDPHTCRIVGFAVATEKEAYYIPTGHEDGDTSQLSQDTVLEQLKPLFEQPEWEVVAQNLKFDLLFLRAAGVSLEGIRCDTMIASYLLNPSGSSHSLKTLSRKHLNHSMIEYDEVTEEAEHFGQVPIEEATRYACEDVTATREIANILMPRLEEENLLELFNHVELPLVPILADMEWTGIQLDPEELQTMQKELNGMLEELEKRAWDEAGEEFNLNSPQQLQEILFDKLDLDPVRKTKTGYSTDADTLEELSDHHPVPEIILEYRSLSKLVNTYANKLPDLVNPKTGRLHTSFHQTRAATGRLSSSEPNLQNIPVRTKEGRRIRKAFVAEEGHKLLSADYSQVELRILAHISGDAAMTEAFQNGEDIHSRTAAEMFDVPLQNVDGTLRDTAKTINFGIVYGISAYGLAQRLDIEPDEASDYIEKYLQRYEGVDRYMKEIVEKAREQGFVETLLGRRRHIHDISSSDYNQRSFAERTAINTPVQGSAADLIKLAMIDVSEALDAQSLSTRLVLQIHDELILEVPDSELMKVESLVEGEMTNAMDLDVPLEVDIHTGDNWADLK